MLNPTLLYVKDAKNKLVYIYMYRAWSLITSRTLTPPIISHWPLFSAFLIFLNNLGYSSSNHSYCCTWDPVNTYSGYLSIKSNWLDQDRAILRLVSSYGQSQAVSIWQLPTAVTWCWLVPFFALKNACVSLRQDVMASPSSPIKWLMTSLTIQSALRAREQSWSVSYAIPRITLVKKKEHS